MEGVQNKMTMWNFGNLALKPGVVINYWGRQI